MDGLRKSTSHKMSDRSTLSNLILRYTHPQNTARIKLDLYLAASACVSTALGYWRMSRSLPMNLSVMRQKRTPQQAHCLNWTENIQLDRCGEVRFGTMRRTARPQNACSANINPAFNSVTHEIPFWVEKKCMQLSEIPSPTINIDGTFFLYHWHLFGIASA